MGVTHSGEADRGKLHSSRADQPAQEAKHLRVLVFPHAVVSLRAEGKLNNTPLPPPNIEKPNDTWFWEQAANTRS